MLHALAIRALPRSHVLAPVAPFARRCGVSPGRSWWDFHDIRIRDIIFIPSVNIECCLVAIDGSAIGVIHDDIIVVSLGVALILNEVMLWGRIKRHGIR